MNLETSILDDLIGNEITNIVLYSGVVLDSDEESQYPEGIKHNVNDSGIDGNGHTRCSGKSVNILLHR